MVKSKDTIKRFSFAKPKFLIGLLGWPSILGNNKQIPTKAKTLTKNSHTFTKGYPKVTPTWVDIGNPSIEPAETPKTILFTLSGSNSPIIVKAILIADE